MHSSQGGSRGLLQPHRFIDGVAIVVVVDHTAVVGSVVVAVRIGRHVCLFGCLVGPLAICASGEVCCESTEARMCLLSLSCDFVACVQNMHGQRRKQTAHTNTTHKQERGIRKKDTTGCSSCVNEIFLIVKLAKLVIIIVIKS